jgi:peptide-methionine (S)-S-oxide reductase
MLPRIAQFGRSLFTGGLAQGTLASTSHVAGQPVEPTTNLAIEAKTNLYKMSANGSGESTNIATFASGCFWGTEHIFRQHYGKGKGLIDAKVGYIGGKESSKNPSYEEVCSGRTGHAEATQINFAPDQVSYAELVEFFYRSHDPTQKDRQGNDRGTQYRSAIFPHNAEQVEVAKRVTKEVEEKHFAPKGKKIATTIEERPASAFFVAEDYHQEYLHHNPNGYQCSTHRLWW